jgi:hypothetical protein
MQEDFRPLSLDIRVVLYIRVVNAASESRIGSGISQNDGVFLFGGPNMNAN